MWVVCRSAVLPCRSLRKNAQEETFQMGVCAGSQTDVTALFCELPH
uniref:Uncharacterized protein n=1 Tax=Anguilla anguilla TaxID=7936 RepID=A0A0E9X0V3_ANGAN